MDGTVRDLGSHFSALVAALPQARQILLEATDEGPRIWTVIDAEPFDRARRERVYAAELEALDTYPSVGVDFRLVNLAEYGAALLTDVLPADAEVLWRTEP